MSYVSIFVVDVDGDVFHFGEARNNHGGAPLIWDFLGEKYGFLDKKKYPYSLMDPGQDALWKSFPNPKMERWETLILGASFDRVWVKRELVSELADALDRFYREYAEPKQFVGTTRDMAKVLRELLEKHPDCLGVAFNMCSAVSSFWSVLEPVEGVEIEEGEEEAEEEYDSRPYNVLRDGKQPRGEYAGKEPWELSAELTLTK